MTLTSIAGRVFAASSLILSLGTTPSIATQNEQTRDVYTFPLAESNINYCSELSTHNKIVAPHSIIESGRLESVNLDYYMLYFAGDTSRYANLYLINKDQGLICSIDSANLINTDAPQVVPATEDFSFFNHDWEANIKSPWCGQRRIAEAEVRSERNLRLEERLSIADMYLDIYVSKESDQHAMLLTKGSAACIINEDKLPDAISPFYSPMSEMGAFNNRYER